MKLAEGTIEVEKMNNGYVATCMLVDDDDDWVKVKMVCLTLEQLFDQIEDWFNLEMH